MTAPKPRRRIALLGSLVLIACMALGMTFDGHAVAKKKKSPSVFTRSLTVNAAIPDVPASPGPSTPVRSTITVPKKFKGKVVDDVNVLGIRTTGNVDGAANDLRMKLTAPNGRTVGLVLPDNPSNGLLGTSVGPLTIDADSRTSICNQPNPVNCPDPSQTLFPPFAGTANQQGLGTHGTGGLPALAGVAMRGNWTFTIWDENDTGETSVFNAWGLQIKAKKPPKSQKPAK